MQEIQLPVLLLHRQKYNNLVAIFDAVINHALMLLWSFRIFCDFKVTGTTMT
jgi:hypothetical protein